MARFEIHATFTRADGVRDSDCIHTEDSKKLAVAFCDSVMANPKSHELTITDVSAWVVDTKTAQTVHGC